METPLLIKNLKGNTREEYKKATNQILEAYDKFAISMVDITLSFFSVSAFAILYAYNAFEAQKHQYLETHKFLAVMNCIGFFLALYAKAVRVGLVGGIKSTGRMQILYRILVTGATAALSSFLMTAITYGWSNFPIWVVVFSILAVIIPAICADMAIRQRDSTYAKIPSDEEKAATAKASSSDGKKQEANKGGGRGKK